MVCVDPSVNENEDVLNMVLGKCRFSVLCKIIHVAVKLSNLTLFFFDVIHYT